MWSPHIQRQILIQSGLALMSFIDGFIIGHTSGMIAGLQADNSDLSLTDDQISWIASTLHVTCICGFTVSAMITEKVGRRKAFMILNTPIALNWIVLYYSKNMIEVVISRSILGVCFGGVLSLSLLVTAEYTSPQVRGIYLTINVSLGPALGVALAHTLGVLYHWRIVALIGIIPSAISALCPWFWVESPTWLASMGKFEECAVAYKSLHGEKYDEKELNLLIEYEKYKQSKNPSTSQYYANVTKKIVEACKQKYFWKIALLCCVLHVYRVATGKNLFYTFTLTMLKDVMGSSDILLSTVIVDAFNVLGACLSCVLISKMKMRSLLFSVGSIAIVLLIMLSSCLYFKPDNNVYFNWFTCFLLSLNYILVNAGPYTVLESLFAEIYPLELKTYCFCGFGIIGGLLLFTSIHLGLTMFKIMGYHGVILLNALVGAICLTFFWFKLPETKGRTLQEIELYFKNNKFCNINKELYEEQIKELVSST